MYRESRFSNNVKHFRAHKLSYLVRFCNNTMQRCTFSRIKHIITIHAGVFKCQPSLPFASQRQDSSSIQYFFNPWHWGEQSIFFRRVKKLFCIFYLRCYSFVLVFSRKLINFDIFFQIALFGFLICSSKCCVFFLLQINIVQQLLCAKGYYLLANECMIFSCFCTQISWTNKKSVVDEIFTLLM